MPRFGKQGRDPPDVVDEAHVEHPVGFVEDKHRHLIELDVAFAEMIEKPPDGRDEDMHALCELARLGLHADAADNDALAQLEMLGVGCKVAVHLHSQLPRRHKNERPRRFSGQRSFA